MRPKSNSKRGERHLGWSKAVDDFALWDEDGDEVQANSRPVVQSARRAHVERNAGASEPDMNKKRRVDNEELSTGSMSDRERIGEERMSATNRKSSSSSISTVSQVGAIETAKTVTTRTPWQYTNGATQTVAATVNEQVLPTMPTPKESPAPPQKEALPQYAYRKPSTRKGPSQQTFRLAFAEVENVEPSRQAENRAFENARCPPYPPSNNKQFSSSSSNSSRLFEGASSSSSRTLPSSSPYTSSHSFSDKTPPSSSYKKPYPSKACSYSKRPMPARVTCRKSITDQTRLAFTPIKQLPSRARQPSSPLPYSNASGPRPFAFQTSSSHRMSPPQQMPRRQPFCRGSQDYQTDDFQRSQQMTPRPVYQPMDYKLEIHPPSRSSRSAIDDAVDREFYRTFEDSPVRERITADCQAAGGSRNSSHWQLQVCSEEERRVRQYPRIFNEDPDSQLKQSKEKMTSFGWSTGRRVAAVKDPILPSAPRLGAASRFRSREISARAAREQQQRHQTPCLGPREMGSNQDQAIRIGSSDTSDEYDFDDFDMQGIREEDLARLEAR